MVLKKMILADNSEINKIILSEIFGKQYEIIQTNNNDEFLLLRTAIPKALSSPSMKF